MSVKYIMDADERAVLEAAVLAVDEIECEFRLIADKTGRWASVIALAVGRPDQYREGNER